MTERAYRIADGVWTVSQNEQWLPGVYDSAETALKACDLTDAQLADLDYIWSCVGEDRPATLADLAAAEAELRRIKGEQ